MTNHQTVYLNFAVVLSYHSIATAKTTCTHIKNYKNESRKISHKWRKAVVKKKMIPKINYILSLGFIISEV